MPELTAEDFAIPAERSLVLTSTHGTLSLTVKEVQPMRHPSPRVAGSFSVVLRDRGATRALPQGIYRGNFGARGEADIFIVPIGPDGEGMCYEAVFN